ncbi:zinc finger, CCHC-type containing protein [Tanacetum coccineum]
MRSHNVEQSRELCCLVIDFLDRETDLTYRWCGRQLICCGGGNGDNDKVDSEYDGGVRPCCDGVGRSSVRLDVTHLIRCNSVCKSWKSLIASSHFIKARLIRSYISHRNNKEIGDRMIVIADLPACFNETQWQQTCNLISLEKVDFRIWQKKLHLTFRNEELTLVDLGNHLHIEESLMMQDNDKPKGNNVAGPSVVNMLEHNNSSRYNDNKGKRKYHDNTKADPNKKSKVTCWKCGKPEHLKKDCKGIKDGNKANGSGTNGSVNGSTNSLKYLKFSSGKIVSLFNVLHVPNILGHVHFKRMQDMYKDGLIPSFDMDTEKYKTCMLNKITKKSFQNVKREIKVLELIHSDLCDLHATPSLGNKKYFVTLIYDASRDSMTELLPEIKVRLDVTHLIRCNSVSMKRMASNFVKLDKFEKVDFRRWQKKMHFLLSGMSVVYVLTTPIPDDGDDATVDQPRKRAKMLNLPKNYRISWRPNIWLRMHKVEVPYFKHTLKHLKEELTLVDLGSHLHIEESLMMQDNDKPKGNNVAGPSVVNMLEHNNSSRYNDNKGKRKYHDNTKADPNKKSKVTCWKCGKPGHLKKDCKGRKVGNKANGSGTNGSVNGSTNSLKCQNMFNKSFQVYYVTYVSEAYYV